jgi:hypothetical protein
MRDPRLGHRLACVEALPHAFDDGDEPAARLTDESAP